jgi:hypothetical protein
METATENIDALIERIDVALRPTPDQIDMRAQQYLAAKLRNLTAAQQLKNAEDELVALVQIWGSVPPNAEKSRRLSGRLAELTVTKSDTITINFERVEVLKDALEANDRGDYFKKLFTLQSKYEIVEGAESALKTESLPKRLAEKVLNLFGRCITVKAKKPSLKVTIADPAKPAKPARRGEKSRAEKGGAQ